MGTGGRELVGAARPGIGVRAAPGAPFRVVPVSSPTVLFHAGWPADATGSVAGAVALAAATRAALLASSVAATCLQFQSSGQVQALSMGRLYPLTSRASSISQR
jgi:hypothetical protein